MSLFIDIGKEIIKYGAPMLGFAIGGPGGATIAAEVARLFGAKEDGSDLLDKLATDPDTKVKLAQIEASKEVELKSLATSLLEAQYSHEDHQADDDIKDVEDARQMETTTHSLFPHVLSCLIIVCFISALISLLYKPIPDDNRELILGLGFALAYAFFMVCRFWLGGVLPVVPLEKMRK